MAIRVQKENQFVFKVNLHSMQQHTNVYSLTLRTRDGRAQSMAAYIPNEYIRQHYISKAHKAGLGIEIKDINE